MSLHLHKLQKDLLRVFGDVMWERSSSNELLLRLTDDAFLELLHVLDPLVGDHHHSSLVLAKLKKNSTDRVCLYIHDAQGLLDTDDAICLGDENDFPCKFLVVRSFRSPQASCLPFKVVVFRKDVVRCMEEVGRFFWMQRQTSPDEGLASYGGGGGGGDAEDPTTTTTTTTTTTVDDGVETTITTIIKTRVLTGKKRKRFANFST